MTVQEEKEVLNNIWDFADAQDEEKGDVVDDAIIEAIDSMEEVEQYRALGTVEELKEAMEKQIAKKPTFSFVGEDDFEDYYECPNCKKFFHDYEEKSKNPKCCMLCGQRLKWSEADD